MPSTHFSGLLQSLIQSISTHQHRVTYQVLHKYGETVDFLQVPVILPLNFGQREMLDKLQTQFNLKQLKLKANPAIKHRIPLFRCSETQNEC